VRHVYRLRGRLVVRTRRSRQKAQDILAKAVADPKFANSFPPMLFHLTDRHVPERPSAVVNRIRQLSTPDVKSLTVNAYIGTQTNLSYSGPEDFPATSPPRTWSER